MRLSDRHEIHLSLFVRAKNMKIIFAKNIFLYVYVRRDYFEKFSIYSVEFNEGWE